MSFALDIITIVAVSAGAFFFLAGTVGLLRFPDTLTRLHALPKADNLGLGLVVRAPPTSGEPALRVEAGQYLATGAAGGRDRVAADCTRRAPRRAGLGRRGAP